MMSPDQARLVANTFRRLMTYENNFGWEQFDDFMSHLEYLEDDELVLEAEVMLKKFEGLRVGCGNKHDGDCHVPKIVEASGYILDLFKETKNLHANNRYILSFFLVMAQLGEIVIIGPESVPE